MSIDAPCSDAVALLKELIAVESHADATDREAEMARFLQAWFEGNGIEATRHPVKGQRCNLIARIPGQKRAPGLLLNGHLDTVPAGEMASAFVPELRRDAVWGRGACDMKGAIAAMACAMAAIARDRDGRPLAGDLVFAGTIGEETGSIGVKALVQQGVDCAYAVVGEPTSLRIGVAHKGACFVRITLTGRGAHGSQPENGVNAVSHACRLVEWLETVLRARCSVRRHPLLGCSTVNVGRVCGGTQPNIVAEQCVVEVDRRTIPGERGVLDEVAQGVSELMAGVDGLRWQVEEMEETAFVPHVPLETPTDAPLVRRIQSVGRVLGLDVMPVGVPYWTDGGHLGAHGVATIILGPGDIAYAHGPHEHVSIAEVELAERLYGELARGLVIGD